MNESVYELIPTNGRKSYYHKALVIVKGTVHYLRSYNTIMCSIDKHNGEIHKYSDYKSMTTCSHLKSFLGEEGYKGFWERKTENRPSITITL